MPRLARHPLLGVAMRLILAVLWIIQAVPAIAEPDFAGSCEKAMYQLDTPGGHAVRIAREQSSISFERLSADPLHFEDEFLEGDNKPWPFEYSQSYARSLSLSHGILLKSGGQVLFFDKSSGKLRKVVAPETKPSDTTNRPIIGTKGVKSASRQRERLLDFGYSSNLRIDGASGRSTHPFTDNYPILDAVGELRYALRGQNVIWKNRGEWQTVKADGPRSGRYRVLLPAAAPAEAWLFEYQYDYKKGRPFDWSVVGEIAQGRLRPSSPKGFPQEGRVVDFVQDTNSGRFLWWIQERPSGPIAVVFGDSKVDAALQRLYLQNREIELLDSDPGGHFALLAVTSKGLLGSVSIVRVHLSGPNRGSVDLVCGAGQRAPS